PTDMRYICYFAGRRVVLDNSVHSYLDFHLPRPKIRERVADIDRFFHDPQKNVDVLFKYNVSYIWVDRDRGLKNLAQNDPFPASEEIILRPPPNYLNPNLKIHLRPVFANQEHLIYEIILK
ncbi:MAG: hypothetical protein N3B16_12400, partial [Candidatus Aminicenantes bacterium]|nr:hypothetical protein [Candidatus Aminicenantes bacterium]